MFALLAWLEEYEAAAEIEFSRLTQSAEYATDSADDDLFID